MYRYIVSMIGLVLLGFFTPIANADQPLTLFDFEDGFNLQTVHTENAVVEFVDGETGQSLDVRLAAHPQNASIRLTSPGWDLSKYLGVAIDVTNRGESDVVVLAKVSVGNEKTSLDSLVSIKPGQAETMFIVFRRAEAPDVLYLGSRIHGSGNPRAAYRVASKYCDVVSMNRYQLAIVEEGLPPGSVDKPMIIGEFHFGALDRGLLHTGLKGVSNQQQRAAAYTDHVRQALENDRIVGAHWFQLTDQLVTGRGDGECYQIGFLDIVDRPYPELVEASRKLGEYLYQYRRSGDSN